LYFTETTQLFTQLWASLQSGEADGGETVRITICIKYCFHVIIYINLV
jgi:hypothetical protein